MALSSRLTKFIGFALVACLFVVASFHGTDVQAVPEAQATLAGTPSCLPLDNSSMMSATPQSGMNAATPNASMGSGFLGAELGAVDNCGMKVLQVFSGSAAAVALQPNDVIVAVDCVALADMIGGSVATTTANSIANCMGSSSGGINATMTGVMNAMANPACMNTGIMGGTLHVTTLFFCIIGQYRAGDAVTLTLWRGSQLMNVAVVLDTAPVATLATP